MRTEIKSEKTYKISISILFISLLLTLAASVFVGEFIFPVSAGLYAVLLLFEKRGHALSFVIAALSVAIAFVPMAFPPVFGIVAVLCGLIIFVFYRLSFAKCDTAIMLSLFIAAAFTACFILAVMMIIDNFSLDAVSAFIKALHDELRAGFIGSAALIGESLPEGAAELELTEEYVAMAFDMAVNLLVSLIFIVSFLLSGIALKIFSGVSRMISTNESDIRNWKFAVPSIYAYIFIAVYLLSSFMYGSDVPDLVVLNLSGILSTIFAYLGLKAAYKLFAQKGRKVLGIVLIVVAVLLVGNLAVDVLSIFGVVSTIQENKLAKNGQGKGPGNIKF